MLAEAGVALTLDADDLIVEGEITPSVQSKTVDVGHDEQMALALLVLGGAARAGLGTRLDRPVSRDFTAIVASMNGLGAVIAEVSS